MQIEYLFMNALQQLLQVFWLLSQKLEYISAFI